MISDPAKALWARIEKAEAEATKFKTLAKEARKEFNDQWMTLSDDWGDSWRTALEDIIDRLDDALEITPDQKDSKLVFRTVAEHRRDARAQSRSRR